MTTNGSLIATLGRTGSGVYQAVKGRIWSGYTPTVVTRPDVMTLTVSNLMEISGTPSNLMGISITPSDLMTIGITGVD